jgi:hypothetical protein
MASGTTLTAKRKEDRTSHITVICRDGGDEITSVYAVNKDISRELDQRIKKPTGKDLQAWLEAKGCRLDSSDRPAYVRRSADGVREEYYYRNGKQHREDGPAVVRREADGSTYEYCYKDGKLVEPFAPPSVIGGVTVRRIAKAPGRQRPPASA